MQSRQTNEERKSPKKSMNEKRKSRKQSLMFIHRTLGLLGSCVILLMAFSGILLNHKSLIGFSTTTDLMLQKMIFALHTGALSNTNFIWLTDFSAVCMIVLSISGIWMWVEMFLRRIKRRDK